MVQNVSNLAKIQVLYETMHKELKFGVIFLNQKYNYYHYYACAVTKSAKIAEVVYLPKLHSSCLTKLATTT